LTSRALLPEPAPAHEQAARAAAAAAPTPPPLPPSPPLVRWLQVSALLPAAAVHRYCHFGYARAAAVAPALACFQEPLPSALSNFMLVSIQIFLC
jgi:hypothetical protein